MGEGEAKTTEVQTKAPREFAPFKKDDVPRGSFLIVSEAMDRLSRELPPEALRKIVTDLESDARKIGMYLVVSHLLKSGVLSAEQSSELFDMYGIAPEEAERLSLPKARRQRE